MLSLQELISKHMGKGTCIWCLSAIEIAEKTPGSFLTNDLYCHTCANPGESGLWLGTTCGKCWKRDPAMYVCCETPMPLYTEELVTYDTKYDTSST